MKRYTMPKRVLESAGRGLEVALKVKVTQLCPILCDPMDCSLPVSSVHGILQAKILKYGTQHLFLDFTKSTHPMQLLCVEDLKIVVREIHSPRTYTVASAMSDSVRPHRRQPTRLRCPWDSPGKNTGVGCHFLLQCVKVKTESEVSQSCPTLSDPMDCSQPGSSVHGILQARVLECGAIAFSDR
ncbi:hypothetical protein MG293_000761 [Ovis ammon polii]|uniref:Uncharacterized protein n=1 Tax=Ovis ammon polii TaxID=230172 RepID=A0AAD4UNG4_OVIAM|nr:hypothetical protein MG293_000761 [Ovis ammon polii]